MAAGRMFRSGPRTAAAPSFLALLREQHQQREEDRAADEDVKGKQHAREPLGQRGRTAQRDPDEPRRKEDRAEGDEPPDAGTHTIEDQRTEWGEDAPDARRAAGQEAAEGDHRQRRR